jgi:serine/threonine-protein phosphatase 6 regulatory ankyrin repeat subunit B
MKIRSDKRTALPPCGLLLRKRNILRGSVFLLLGLFLTPSASAQRRPPLTSQNKGEAVTKASALLQAVQQQDVNGVQTLLGQGIRANVVDVQGRTPLMWAAMRANIPLCRLLLLYGANLNQRDNRGYTALSLSIDEGGLYWMAAPPASAVSEADYVATAKWLVLHGASLQLTGTTWDGLLDLTHHRLHAWIPMCMFLLQHGATIQEGKSGRAVILEDAVYANSAVLLSLILQHRPAQQQKDAALQTALEQGVYYRHSVMNRQCIRLLLEAGASPNVQAGDESSALQLAVYAEDVELARLLLKHGAEVNFKHRRDGFTPLATAKWRNNIAMQELLQQNGAK